MVFKALGGVGLYGLVSRQPTGFDGNGLLVGRGGNRAVDSDGFAI